MIHELKTWSEYFEQVFMGRKTFELRKNDRDFKVGDTLILQEGDLQGYPDKTWTPTGRTLARKVTYILHGGQFGIERSGILRCGALKYVCSQTGEADSSTKMRI